jgi:ABC-type transport system substrate-binding protein
MPGFKRRSIFPLGGDSTAARRLAGAIHKTAVLYSCNLSLCRQQAQQISHDLSRIGIAVDIKEFPPQVIIERALRPGEPFDILLAWRYVDYADPYDILNVLLDPKGNLSHFHSDRYDTKLEQVAQLSGSARYRSYGKLALELAQNATPWVVYATGTSRDFFSARTGCQTFNPVCGMDLAALCLRREPQRHQ